MMTSDSTSPRGSKIFHQRILTFISLHYKYHESRIVLYINQLLLGDNIPGAYTWLHWWFGYICNY